MATDDRARGFFDRLLGRRCAWPMLPPIGHASEAAAEAYIDGWHAAAPPVDPFRATRRFERTFPEAGV